jgi:hypothetical protein
MTIQDARTLIAEINKLAYKATDWEEKFLQSIAARGFSLSTKQSKALMSIYEKATNGGMFQKREYIKNIIIE